jgi:hypothetical protein
VGNALNSFLKMENVGSPIEAAELGRPVNGLEPVGEKDIVDVYPRDVMEQHARLVRWFEEAERASQDARAAAERDRDYVCGIQYTADELAALRRRGQPPITINYVSRKVQLLAGMERKGRTDPVAYPRTPAEEDRADAATQALRFIADDQQMPVIRSAVYENLLVEGYGGLEIGLENDGKGGANITLTHVSWERLFHDPHSRAGDFSDARYLGMVLWMDRDQLEDLYPQAGDVLDTAFAAQGGSYSDRPGAIVWQDSTRERCRVVQVYWREGADWWGATITKTGFLSEPVRSVFRDRQGRSACPLILQSAYIDRDNRRYGMVRDLISLQDEINKRRSKALHLLTMRQVIAETGAVVDVDKARREVAKPDGWVEVSPQMRFEIAQNNDLTTGQFNLLEHATQEMQASGPNASMSGNDPRDLSGRAIMAQQAGGAAQNEPLSDALRQWTRRVYEVAWMAVREYWRGPRWLRVTDDLGKLKFVGVNRQITLADRLAEMPEEMRGMALQRLGMVPNDPRLMQVVGTASGHDPAGCAHCRVEPQEQGRAARPHEGGAAGTGAGTAGTGTDRPGRGTGRGRGEADASAAQRSPRERSAAHLGGTHRAGPQGRRRKPGHSRRGAGHPTTGTTNLSKGQKHGISRRTWRASHSRRRGASGCTRCSQCRARR